MSEVGEAHILKETGWMFTDMSTLSYCLETFRTFRKGLHICVGCVCVRAHAHVCAPGTDLYVI